jgi:U3 small nucleolar RNA-associated protein 14
LVAYSSKACTHICESADTETVVSLPAAFLQERLTLKHRNSSKWARRALKRGQAAMDPSTREAIAEQLALGQQLRRRIEGKRGDSDDEEGGDSDDRWVRGQCWATRAAERAGRTGSLGALL